MPSVLLICPYFPPTAASGAHRMLGFARHLPKFGWDVSVLTCAPVWFEPQDNGLTRLIPQETAVTYIDYPKGRVAHLIEVVLAKQGISDYYWLWNRSAANACNGILRSRLPNVILTSGPPHSTHLLGRKLKHRFDVPWIADFRDPWQPNSRGQRLERRWGSIVMREADAVVANAPCALNAMKRAYPSAADKMLCITNGFDPELIPARMREAANGHIELLHAGELYADRDPRPLLDALGQLRANSSCQPACHVTFIGSADWCGFSLKEEIDRRGYGELVTATGHIPYEAVKQRMVDADILLLLDAPGRCTGVPAKLYEYIGCQRPILALAEHDGDTAWVLRTSGVPHRIVHPHDVTAIQQAISELIEFVQKGPFVRRDGLATSNFTREEAARQLAATLAGLARSCTSPSLVVNTNQLWSMMASANGAELARDLRENLGAATQADQLADGIDPKTRISCIK